MNTPEAKPPRVEEIDLLDYAQVLVKRRRMIARNALYAALLMAVISLILPKTYTATATLLPPDKSEDSGLRALLSQGPASFLNLPGLPASSSEVLVEILQSRSVAEGVLARPYRVDEDSEARTLYQIWDLDSRQEALEKLSERTRIFASEQGLIHISVEMRNPRLAAQVANAYTAELDRVNQEKSVSRAKNSRLYIEAQLKITRQRLQQASEALAAFQAQYKAVDLQEQTKVAIEKAGEIKGTILAKEVELQVLLQTLKPDNPVVLRLQKELEELRKQFDHLQFGNAVPFEQQRDYFIPFSEVPEVGLKLAELMREVKVQETVWQLLNQQYYSAKIQEARDTPTVQVLDEAVVPEKRTRPKRTLLVLVAFVLALTASTFWAFVLEYNEKVRARADEAEKVNRIVSELKADYQTMRKGMERAAAWLKNRLGRRR